MTWLPCVLRCKLTSHINFTWRRKISANCELINQICQELSAILELNYKKHDLFACDLLLREMLLNSINHGCNGKSEKLIRLKFSLSDHHFQITIKDPGNGFNHAKEIKSIINPENESGRGLQIIRKYSDKIRFNKSGNCISIKRFF
ncbi:MAG: ATP-binding protein [Candidatus Riflebacteria bacterium]